MKVSLRENDPVLNDIMVRYLRDLYEVDYAFDSKKAEELLKIFVISMGIRIELNSSPEGKEQGLD